VAKVGQLIKFTTASTMVMHVRSISPFEGLLPKQAEVEEVLKHEGMRVY
jgi:hypothetical protein